jgi:hypothetical protein
MLPGVPLCDMLHVVRSGVATHAQHLIIHGTHMHFTMTFSVHVVTG